MRTITNNFVMALVATTVVLVAGVACGRDLSDQQPAIDDTARTPASSVRAPLGIGDRLKISFYETIDVGDMKRGGQDSAEPQGTLRTFYQRMDLSGEYAVEQDGAISIPLLGRFQVEGRALDDLRADLAISFTGTIGRTADVSATITDRSPIYVVGPVKNPGAYKYVPGMMVLHAIALAGGLDRGQQNLSGMIEGVREMERLRTKADQVKRLLARRARLEAQRDGISTLPMPVQLTTLAGEHDARTFLAAESAVLRAEQAKRQHQENEIAAKIAAARDEVEALKRKLDQADIQKEIRIERLNGMQKLKDKGIVTNYNLVVLRTELSDIEAHRQDYLVAVLQAETRFAEAEEARARLRSESTANLAKEIATIDQEIAVAQEAMASAGRLTTILSNFNGYMPQAQTYEIVRQSKDGAKTLKAADISSLMPGDVLKIVINSGTSTPPSEQTMPDLRQVRGE
jgi:protein involved in polysaccharide export with SLBB domain